MENRINRNILCIDLKSFFAACECVERHLDLFKTPLVVVSKMDGDGALTLAVTPYLKSKGVASRGRLYEIPPHIKYIKVPPRMSLYISKSKEVIKIFLNYVSEEDLHVYSIDEAFLDVTDYLHLYKMSDIELGKKIMQEIKEKLGLYATCGVGPNMLLAKIAMDVEAKHKEDCIAKWTYDEVETKLWKIEPLSEMWGIGTRMENNLNKLGIYNVYDLAHYNKYALKDKFGVIGVEMWRHANGIDNSIIKDKNKIKNVSKSYGISQILFKDYNRNNVRIIIDEMAEVISTRLRKNNKVGNIIGFGIGYSKESNGGFYHSIKLDSDTDDKYEILKCCMFLFDNYYKKYPIRRVSVSIGGIKTKKYVQLSLFKDINKEEEKSRFNIVVDSINDKYGKNSILKATSLLEDSTIKERNKKIGGHYSG